MTTNLYALCWLLCSALGLYAQNGPYSREDLLRMIENANGRDEVQLRAELAMLYLSERAVTVTQEFDGRLLNYSEAIEPPDLDKARAEIQAVQRTSRQISYTDGQAVGHYLEGMYHIANRDTMQALRALNQWFAVRTQQGDPAKARWAYFGKYEYELRLGQHDAAAVTLEAILTALQPDAGADAERRLQDAVGRVKAINSLYELTYQDELLYDLLIPELEKLTLFLAENPNFLMGVSSLVRLDDFFSHGIRAALNRNDIDRVEALGHQWLSSIDRLAAPDQVYQRARRIAAWCSEAGQQAIAYNFLVVSIDQAKRTQNLALIHEAHYNNVYYARQYGDMARGLKTLQSLYPFTRFDAKFQSALNACMNDFLRTRDVAARAAAGGFLRQWRAGLDPARDQALLLWCDQQLALLDQ